MRKWLLIIVGLISVIVIWASWFYQSIQNDFNEAEEHAIKSALAETSLSHADSVEFFAGESDYVIVYGTNDEDEEILVWVGQDIHEEKVEDGMSKPEIRAIVKEQHEEVEIIRLTPGKWNEQLIWEAYYKKKEDGEEVSYYEYYRFANGERLDTYRLGGN
jgi:uncharacterized protein YpmB